MGNIVLMAVCLLAGLLLRKTGRFPKNTPEVLNGYVIYVALPAAALLYLHSIPFDFSMIMTPLMPWLLFLLSWVFFILLGRLLQLPRRTVGALILLGGLGNTSFVGLPMIEAYYGHELIGVGILADQLGSFMVLSTLGVLVASAYSSGDSSLAGIPRKILLFPPFQAMVLALLLRPFPFPEWLTLVLRKLADTVSPLALVSVGFQLRMLSLHGLKLRLAAGLGFKLVLAPAVLTLIYVGLLGLHGPAIQVTLFEAAMAPMITAGIIAVDNDLDPPLVTMLLGIGIPLSFITLAIWSMVLAGLA